MELQLEQRRALDGLRLHVLDAGDVEEVILVIISEVALHLRRVHAAVRLRHVNGGNAQRGEDVARHLLQGQRGPQGHRRHPGQDGERTAQGLCDQIHDNCELRISTTKSIIHLHSSVKRLLSR